MDRIPRTAWPHRVVWSAAVLLLLACTARPETAVQLVRIDSLPSNGAPGDARSRLVLSDSTTAEIPIRDAALVVALPASRGADWLLLRGVECSECDASTMLWLFRAAPGVVATRGLSFEYPGTQFEPGADAPQANFRSRLFVGTCLEEPEVVAVWLEETLRPADEAKRMVRILRATPEPNVRTAPWTDALVRGVEARVASRRCREVAPEDQIIL